jgi:hypothetical protein
MHGIIMINALSGQFHVQVVQPGGRSSRVQLAGTSDAQIFCCMHLRPGPRTAEISVDLRKLLARCDPHRPM